MFCGGGGQCVWREGSRQQQQQENKAVKREGNVQLCFGANEAAARQIFKTK